MKRKLCNICEDQFVGWGNNPKPYIKKGKKLDVADRCCDDCNIKFVRPSRLLTNNSRPDLN